MTSLNDGADDSDEDDDCLCLRFYYHMYGVGIGDLLVLWLDTSDKFIGRTIIRGGAYGYTCVTSHTHTGGFGMCVS